MISVADVTKFNLESVDVSTLSIDVNEFYQPPGQQHYKLLGHLAKLINNSTIIDIGTHRGSSALALSTNPTNTIHSFDIIPKVEPHGIISIAYILL